tara:strand:- start:125 stop:367 length:243 start_codon:yes stop_codon:yes gene_type:complete
MTLASDNAENRNLSHASLALDTSSRKNTSLLLYKELTIKSINRCTCERRESVTESIRQSSEEERVFFTLLPSRAMKEMRA